MRDPDAPLDVVVGFSDHPGLIQKIAELQARGGRLLVVTDDADAATAHALGIEALEIDALAPDGVGRIEQAFDDHLDPWLRTLFPGETAGTPLAELLRASLLLQPDLRERIDAVASADEFFRQFRPRSMTFVGPMPSFCVTLSAEARRRGIAVSGDTPGLWERLSYWPLGLVRAAGLIGLNAVRLLRRVRERKKTTARLEALTAGGALGDGSEPSLWVVLSPRWAQPGAHIVKQVIGGFEEEGIPYGIAFSANYGEGGVAAEGVDEMSLFDGKWARARPSAVGQVTGVTEWRDAAGLLGGWIRLTVPSCWRALRHCDGFSVGAQQASFRRDHLSLLRVATQELLRTLDAQRAAEAWVARHPRAKTAVFSWASVGEVQVVDRILQRAGITTIDYAHGAVDESNLRTHWRSHSVFHLAWTLRDSGRFAELKSNRRCLGGYMPRPSALPKRKGHARDGRPCILVTTNYLLDYWSFNGRLSTLKHARRLAAALEQLVAHHDGRARVIFRPHPLENRDTWRALFSAGAAPPFSDKPSLAEDLARADILLSTKSSTVIEALTAGIPILMHSGMVVEKKSLFGLVPPKRWFANGDELKARIDELLDGRIDLGPEQRLLEACFGRAGRPLSILEFIKGLEPGLPMPSDASVR